MATVGPPGRLLGTPQNDQKSVLVNIYSRMRHSISWWDKGAKGRIMNAIKATMSRDLHGRLAKLQRARVETVTRPAGWARQVVANRL